MSSPASTSAHVVGRLLGAWRDGGASQPAYQALARGLRAAVLDGRLALGTRLPAERELASALGMSRTTVAAGYALLRDEGWIRSRRGSGSVVELPDGGVAQPGLTPYWGAPFPGTQDDVIDLTTASLPAPLESLQRAVDAAVAQLPAIAAESGYHPYGLPSLRAAVARMYDADGVATSPDQILVTNGAQHGFGLALGELTGSGDRVLMECPTYPVALDLVRATGRVPAPFGLRVDDGSPWDAELLATTLRQTAPPLAYLQADFQNPTGALMSAGTRQAVVDAARRSSTMVLVDESFRDGGFGVQGDLPPRLAAFDRSGRVLSVGTLSKSLWGGLRVGWIRTTPTLVNRLAVARSMNDMAGPVLEQLIAAQFFADPHGALQQQRARLRSGLGAVQQALAEHAPTWPATRPLGGASLWLRLPAAVATEAARLAPGVGVRIVPGPRFGPDGTMDSYVRVPFTAPADVLLAAVPRVVTAVRAAMDSRTTGRRLEGWLT